MFRNKRTILLGLILALGQFADVANADYIFGTPNSKGFVAPFVISDRPRTEAKVPWEPDPWDGGGQKIQTVNIASIIQELIDQEGWAVGNAVEIIIGADPSKPAYLSGKG